MRLPRDVGGPDLVRKLAVLEYQVTRQVGSHIRLTTLLKGEHHVTIPNHKPLKLGTLSHILTSVAVIIRSKRKH
jgi:predicted RNA binding protein YcfA (HicA-like mRNA interferase family)